MSALARGKERDAGAYRSLMFVVHGQQEQQLLALHRLRALGRSRPGLGQDTELLQTAALQFHSQDDQQFVFLQFG